MLKSLHSKLRLSLFVACSLFSFHRTSAQTECKADLSISASGPTTFQQGGNVTLSALATVGGFAIDKKFNDEVHAIVVQPDGKVIVGGVFTSFGGDESIPKSLIRLNPDGTIDPTFNFGGTGIN